jgi:hypothetical protein
MTDNTETPPAGGDSPALRITVQGQCGDCGLVGPIERGTGRVLGKHLRDDCEIPANTPVTEAGQAYLAELPNDSNRWHRRDAILAIEAEAAAAVNNAWKLVNKARAAQPATLTDDLESAIDDAIRYTLEAFGGEHDEGERAALFIAVRDAVAKAAQARDETPAFPAQPGDEPPDDYAKTWYEAGWNEAGQTRDGELLAALKEALDGWKSADALADSEFRISTDPPCKDETRIAELRALIKKKGNQ